MLKQIIGMSLVLTSLVASSQNDPAFNARYQVTFIADWSQNTHPVGFPGNPHFSGLIGATHGPDVHLWQMGELATPGIRLMAETGSKSTLSFEINGLINDQLAENMLSGSGIGTSPGSVSLTFNVSQADPMVSLVTMIAPSPDWFVGVDSLNLRNNGQWQETVTIDLHAYDAGTDSGNSYTASNQASNPPEAISVISDSPFDNNPILGQFVFELIETEDNFPLNGNQSGLYFNPANSGDGVTLVISESDDRNFMLVTWYTYRDGQQMWLVGSADFAAGDTSVEVNMIRSTGAGFGAEFNSEDVETIPWGSLTITIPSCGHMNMAFNGSEIADEFGTVAFAQLAGVGGLVCE